MAIPWGGAAEAWRCRSSVRAGPRACVWPLGEALPSQGSVEVPSVGAEAAGRARLQGGRPPRSCLAYGHTTVSVSG